MTESTADATVRGAADGRTEAGHRGGPERRRATVDRTRAPDGRTRDRALRLALRLDAVASAGLGAALALAAPVLAGPLGTPRVLLWSAGGFLVGWAVALWVLGSGEPVRRGGAWSVVAVNALWAVGSVLLVLTRAVDLTGWGVAVVLAQAAAVLLLTELQVVALRRAGASGAGG